VTSSVRRSAGASRQSVSQSRHSSRWSLPPSSAVSNNRNRGCARFYRRGIEGGWGKVGITNQEVGNRIVEAQKNLDDVVDGGIAEQRGLLDEGGRLRREPETCRRTGDIRLRSVGDCSTAEDKFLGAQKRTPTSLVARLRSKGDCWTSCDGLLRSAEACWTGGGGVLRSKEACRTGVRAGLRKIRACSRRVID
jgi:hypothetical protein